MDTNRHESRGDGKTRNPRAEIRRKSEARNPKSRVTAAGLLVRSSEFWLLSGFGFRVSDFSEAPQRVRLKVAGTRWWVLSRCDKTSPRRAGGSAVVKDAPSLPPTHPRRSARRDCSQREQFHLPGLPATFNRTPRQRVVCNRLRNEHLIPSAPFVCLGVHSWFLL